MLEIQKVKIGVLAESVKGLEELLKQPLQGKLFFRVKRIVEQVMTVVAPFEEARIKICENYGTIDPTSNRYVFATEDLAKQFQTEFIELANEEIEIKGQKLTEDDLADIVLLPIYFEQLLWLVEVADEKSNAVDK